MLELLFGTSNPGKLSELCRMMEGLAVRILTPDDLGRPLPVVVEDGETFLENAEKKASAQARALGVHVLADDSGLCVDALGGAPGVHSARWAALDDLARGSPPQRSRAELDQANNAKLLAALDGIPDAQRGAHYAAVLALARPDGTIAAVVEGRCSGRIGQKPRGTHGFGYDPVFIPAAADAAKTMAEIEPAAKDAISHRGAALRALRPVLEKLAFYKRPRGG